jgi:hypothetical protein
MWIDSKAVQGAQIRIIDFTKGEPASVEQRELISAFFNKR